MKPVDKLTKNVFKKNRIELKANDCTFEISTIYFTKRNINHPFVEALFASTHKLTNLGDFVFDHRH